jgi:hypothetical protein
MTTTLAAHRAQERRFLAAPALGADAAGAPASNLALFRAISGLYRDVDLGQPRARIARSRGKISWSVSPTCSRWRSGGRVRLIRVNR